MGTGTRQKGAIVAVARAVRAATPHGTMRLCLHQAEAAKRMLAQQGIAAKVEIGAVRLHIGRDRISPLELVYDPREVPGEWHAWCSVGKYIADCSIADLHYQMMMTGQAHGQTYRPRKPFMREVLVEEARKVRPSRYTALDMQWMYEDFLATRADMDTVAQFMGGE